MDSMMMSSTKPIMHARALITSAFSTNPNTAARRLEGCQSPCCQQDFGNQMQAWTVIQTLLHAVSKAVSHSFTKFAHGLPARIEVAWRPKRTPRHSGAKNVSACYDA